MFFLLIDRPRSILIGDNGGLMDVRALLSMIRLDLLPLLLLLPEDREEDGERRLYSISMRHSSRLTLASGIDGLAEASRISVNFEVVIVRCVRCFDRVWGWVGLEKGRTDLTRVSICSRFDDSSSK